MSTAADIWEVMAEEIGGRPHDRLEMFRGAENSVDASIRYGTGNGEAALLAAEIDPDDGVSGNAALAFACKHYDVPVEDVCNPRVRRTAVLAARVSIATRLAAAKWTGTRIARLLKTAHWNVYVMLKGGRGQGKLASSKISKDLVARRSKARRLSAWQPRVRRNGGGLPPAIQAVDTLRRLRAAGEEQHFTRVMKLYFPKLDVDEVYDRAFGTEPLPLTLDEARTMEARGEGTIRFVGGVPTWLPAAQPQLPPPAQEPPDVRAVAPQIAE